MMSCGGTPNKPQKRPFTPNMQRSTSPTRKVSKIMGTTPSDGTSSQSRKTSEALTAGDKDRPSVATPAAFLKNTSVSLSDKTSSTGLRTTSPTSVGQAEADEQPSTVGLAEEGSYSVLYHPSLVNYCIDCRLYFSLRKRRLSRWAEMKTELDGLVVYLEGQGLETINKYEEILNSKLHLFAEPPDETEIKRLIQRLEVSVPVLVEKIMEQPDHEEDTEKESEKDSADDDSEPLAARMSARRKNLAGKPPTTDKSPAARNQSPAVAVAPKPGSNMLSLKLSSANETSAIQKLLGELSHLSSPTYAKISEKLELPLFHSKLKNILGKESKRENLLQAIQQDEREIAARRESVKQRKLELSELESESGE